MPGVVSFNPKTFAEGGAVPVDRNLFWQKCRFVLFNYTKKDGTIVATTTSAEIHYKDDDGAEYTQQYSAAGPDRFLPSEDGKTLVPVGNAQVISKTANFSILMTALANCGCPEHILDSGDISLLDGLRTHNIGMPEPQRVGLDRPAPAAGEKVYPRVISVPDAIISAPWDKGAKAGKGAAKAAESNESVNDALLAFLAKATADGPIAKQKLANRVFRDLAKDPNKDGVARAIFSADFPALLAANGYTIEIVDGAETISAAE